MWERGKNTNEDKNMNVIYKKTYRILIQTI